MRSELWAVGSFFGKKGMSTAGLAPEQGLAVRLAVSTTVLILLAAPKLPARALGMLAFYIALKRGNCRGWCRSRLPRPCGGSSLGWWRSWSGSSSSTCSAPQGLTAKPALLIV
ncbi:MAG: hypothetical protein NUV94_03980 [Candidatus Acetothermia bacterium]|jgi:hypothetical protein|nr:hypothetical protein [Candidatus Acetothermia bacterium]